MFVQQVNDFWKFLLIFFFKKSGFAFLEILQKKQKFLSLRPIKPNRNLIHENLFNLQYILEL